MSRRVVVTGVGLVTPLGPTAPSTWARLLAGETAVRALRPEDLPPVSGVKVGGKGKGNAGEGSSVLAPTHPPPTHPSQEHAAALRHLPCRIGAPVDIAGLASLAHAPAWLAFGPPPGATRAAAFAVTAAAEAVAAARLDMRSLCPTRVAVAVGAGMPAVRSAAALGASLAAQTPRPWPSAESVARLLASGPAAAVAAALGIAGGPLDAPATACAAGASAVADAAAAIAAGDADVALAGGTEACVDAVTIAGFSR